LFENCPGEGFVTLGFVKSENCCIIYLILGIFSRCRAGHVPLNQILGGGTSLAGLLGLF
jgi:hypothetical protein